MYVIDASDGSIVMGKALKSGNNRFLFYIKNRNYSLSAKIILK